MADIPASWVAQVQDPAWQNAQAALGNGALAFAVDGNAYVPIMGRYVVDINADVPPMVLEGFMGGTPFAVGQPYNLYDRAGNLTQVAAGVWEKGEWWTSPMIGLAMVLAPFAMAIAGVGAAAGGAATTAAPAATVAAGDAFLPGALAATGGESLAWGAVIPGLEAYVLPLGAGAAGAGAGAAAASTTPSLSSLGGAVSGLAGTVAKVAGALGAVLGLTQGGQGADPFAPGAYGPEQFTPIDQLEPQSDAALWIALGAGALVLLS